MLAAVFSFGYSARLIMAMKAIPISAPEPKGMIPEEQNGLLDRFKATLGQLIDEEFPNLPEHHRQALMAECERSFHDEVQKMADEHKKYLMP